MKIFDPKRHLPVGWDWEQLRSNLCWGHFFSAVPALSFLGRYADARASLYAETMGPNGTAVRELIPGRIITPFPQLMRGIPLLGLWCFLGLMLLLVWRYYASHTRDAMSIYTMRRLPDRWELHRRCWTQPLLSCAAELVLFAALTLVFFALYFLATPKGHLPM